MLSLRIHYGKFIAEVKYNENPKEYAELARRQDRAGILQLLTNKQVEEKLLKRLHEKALAYGQLDETVPGKEGSSESSLFQGRRRIHAKNIVDIYEKIVIPLTKQVEVEYLLQRV